MLSTSPRWGPRVGYGRCSNPQEPTAIAFLCKELTVKGDQFLRTPPVKIYFVGPLVTLNTKYSDKAVYRVGSPYIIVLQRGMTVQSCAIAAVRPWREGQPGSPGDTQSGGDPRSTRGPTSAKGWILRSSTTDFLWFTMLGSWTSAFTGTSATTTARLARVLLSLAVVWPRSALVAPDARV